ncbi:hypothetical protein [Argonema antarcticum]|nr:hypothetical protein [Argonema antarcticum]MCL1473777.1 hypothetical protein [Argonema antarcticum A004/B2]
MRVSAIVLVQLESAIDARGWMWVRSRVRAVGNRAGGIGECERECVP